MLSRAVNPSLVISAEECVMSLSGIALLFIPSGEKQSSCKPRVKVFFIMLVMFCTFKVVFHLLKYLSDHCAEQ